MLLVVPLLVAGLSLPALIGNDAVGDDDVVGTMAIISMTIIQGKRRFFATFDHCFGNMLVDTSFASLIMVSGYLSCLSLRSYQYSTVSGVKRFHIVKITIPFHNQYAKVIGFQGRVIEKAEPKYINPANNDFYKKSI